MLNLAVPLNIYNDPVPMVTNIIPAPAVNIPVVIATINDHLAAQPLTLAVRYSCRDNPRARHYEYRPR